MAPINGRDGRDGRDGKRGQRGEPGHMGPMPRHEWDGSKVRFQKNDGTYSDWHDLKGLDGEKGETGDEGKNAYDLAVESGFEGDVSEWLSSLTGEKGDSAYLVARKQGFTGTPAEWLLALVGKAGERGPRGAKGDKGDKGDPGAKGSRGERGDSAYLVWLGEGNEGTEEDFFKYLASLVKESIGKIVPQPMGAGPLRIRLNTLKDVNTDGAVTGNVLLFNGTKWVPGSTSGTGDVQGPASSTANGLAAFNGTGGKVLKDTGITFTGSTINGNVSGNAGTVSTISGRIVQGTNVTIDGAGTSVDPYVVNSSGGGGDGNKSPGIAIFTGTTGVVGRIIFPYSCTLKNWYLIADQAGDISIDLLRSGASIVGAGNKPALVSGDYASAAIVDWTSNVITAGDMIEYELESFDTIQECTLTFLATPL